MDGQETSEEQKQQQHQEFRSPASILQARSVAIVGASPRGRWPGRIFENLRDYGYPGKIYPINPRYDEVWGVRCYRDFASLPEPPQHALIIVPPAAVQEVVAQGVAAGLKSAIVYASSIGEGQDPEIVARGTALKSLAERAGLALAGPNCMGSMSMREKCFFYPNSELCELAPGGVALVSQSGGTLQFLAKSAGDRGVKFSYMISSGNELCLDLADYIDFLVEDEATRVIALFIEGVRRPASFMRAAAKALAAGKPLIAIKTGKSQGSRAAAQSHTGAIAGDYDVFSAMCRRYGIAIAQSLDDLVELMLAFQAGRLPRGNRVGFVTTSGGTVDLLYDYVEEIGGLAMPDFSESTKAAVAPFMGQDAVVKNPLDAGIPSTDEASAKTCIAVASDAAIDMIAWAGQLPSGKRARDASALKSVLAATDKPVIGFGRMTYMLGPQALAFQDEVGFPFLQGLQPTVRALKALADYAARQSRKAAALPSPRGLPAVLGPASLAAALAANGITPPASAVARTPEEAAVLAGRIGFPVAIKIQSADISHKTELGGVRLDLADAAQVEREGHALLASVAARAPAAHIEGLLVQEMVRGIEVILGARNDPLYGPVLLVGAGGVLVELAKDVAFALLPIDAEEARRMLAGLKLAKLLEGFRGAPASDSDALVAAMLGLSDFFCDHRHILADLEINPLIVLPKGKGVRAVDIRPVPASAMPL
jgi:acyl-CoA synthetase (NDP forming)